MRTRSCQFEINGLKGEESKPRRIPRAFWLVVLLAFAVQTASVEAATSEGVFDIDARLREMSSTEPDGHRGGVVLVLSGGGTKGFAHLGVLKVLEEMRVPIVGIVGTSIGSVIGGLYATGMRADELHAVVMDTNIMGLLADSGTRIKPGAGDHRPVGENVNIFQTQRDKKFKSAGPLGILPAASLLGFLNKYIGDVQRTDFMKLPIPFACVATDIGTGETVVLRNGNMASAIRASVAIPGLLEPWPLDGRLLVDGGLVANLPVEIARDLFPGYPVLAVNLTGPSIAKNNDQFASVIDILVQTIDVMTIDRIKHNEALANLVLYPDVSGLTMLDATGYEAIFQRGLQVALDKQEEIAALSGSAPLPPPHESGASVRIVRELRVEGLSRNAAAEIEHYYEDWIGKPYNAGQVNDAMALISKREEIATVDIDLYPASTGDPNDIVVVFSVERRAPYEFALDGYTSSMHSHRWLGLTFTGRDLVSEGDSGSAEGRLGDEEWGVRLRYFTPLADQKQWGIALNAMREQFEPDGMGRYTLDRYSGRILYYREGVDRRIGLGVAVDRTNAAHRDSTAWGPYLYFNRDTLDNALVPTHGHSITSRIWWNTEEILVSHTTLTAYIPMKSQMHFVLNFGLKTGDREHQAYRALLGSNEELFSLARHPYVGDQAAWAHLGLGYNFYSSWWGALRGEIFAAYGIVMDDWLRAQDAWETGIAFSAPGQFFNGRLLFVYDDGGEWTVGFTIGTPRWWSSPLP